MGSAPPVNPDGSSNPGPLKKPDPNKGVPAAEEPPPDDGTVS